MTEGASISGVGFRLGEGSPWVNVDLYLLGYGQAPVWPDDCFASIRGLVTTEGNYTRLAPRSLDDMVLGDSCP